jgi:beta-N-acetylhexosaminidase
MAPFRAAVSAEVAGVMTAHILYPALDAERPATLSRTIVRGMLRDEVGHRGLIVTDDLEMGAITHAHTVERAAVSAIDAGCDTLLLCGGSIERHASVVEALIRAVEDKTLDVRDVEDALERHRTVKALFLGGERPRRPLAGKALQSRLGSSASQLVAEDIARA